MAPGELFSDAIGQDESRLPELWSIIGELVAISSREWVSKLRNGHSEIDVDYVMNKLNEV